MFSFSYCYEIQPEIVNWDKELRGVTTTESLIDYCRFDMKLIQKSDSTIDCLFVVCFL